MSRWKKKSLFGSSLLDETWGDPPGGISTSGSSAASGKSDATVTGDNNRTLNQGGPVGSFNITFGDAPAGNKSRSRGKGKVRMGSDPSKTPTKVIPRTSLDWTLESLRDAYKTATQPARNTVVNKYYNVTGTQNVDSHNTATMAGDTAPSKTTDPPPRKEEDPPPRQEEDPPPRKKEDPPPPSVKPKKPGTWEFEKESLPGLSYLPGLLSALVPDAKANWHRQPAMDRWDAYGRSKFQGIWKDSETDPYKGDYFRNANRAMQSGTQMLLEQDAQKQAMQAMSGVQKLGTTGTQRALASMAPAYYQQIAATLGKGYDIRDASAGFRRDLMERNTDADEGMWRYHWENNLLAEQQKGFGNAVRNALPKFAAGMEFSAMLNDQEMYRKEMEDRLGKWKYKSAAEIESGQNSKLGRWRNPYEPEFQAPSKDMNPENPNVQPDGAWVEPDPLRDKFPGGQGPAERMNNKGLPPGPVQARGPVQQPGSSTAPTGGPWQQPQLGFQPRGDAFTMAPMRFGQTQRRPTWREPGYSTFGFAR